jgi:hypothetical protein
MALALILLPHFTFKLDNTSFKLHKGESVVIAEGKRFWLMCTEKTRKNQILRIWEDGRIENIAESQKENFYIKLRLFSLFRAKRMNPLPSSQRQFIV